MIPKIKRYKDSLFPEYHWVVMSDNVRDLCRTLGRAIRYWLWNCGMPARIAFRKYRSNGTRSKTND